MACVVALLGLALVPRGDRTVEAPGTKDRSYDIQLKLGLIRIP